MRRKPILLLSFLLVLGGGYWGYTRLLPEEYVEPAPRLSEETPAGRLGAMQAFCEEINARQEAVLESVEIQHLLVSFADPASGLELATRSRAQAEQLAADLYSQVRAGEDFDDLVLEHTDDSPPGIFVLAIDTGTLPEAQAADAVGRADFVPAIGDLSWRLEVGEVGVAAYDPERCPLGWHLIKRLR